MAQNERGVATVWTDEKNHRFIAKGLVCAWLDRAGQLLLWIRTTRQPHIHTRHTRTAGVFLVPATDIRLLTAATTVAATTANHIAAAEGRMDVAATTHAVVDVVIVSVLSRLRTWSVRWVPIKISEGKQNICVVIYFKWKHVNF